MHEGRRVFECGAYLQLCFILRRGVLKAAHINKRALRAEAFIRIRGLFTRELRDGRRLFECGVSSPESSARGGVYLNMGSIFARELRDGRCLFECGIY